MITKQPDPRQNACLKCGTCCRKNSPVLHLEDLELIRKKILLPENMILLRRGEPALDNILGRPVLLEKELIKIRGKGRESWTCIFHDQETSLCLIHRDRPLQCRTLECWNTSGITELYSRDTLSRKDIFTKGSALEEITMMHQEQCPVETFVELLRVEISSPGKAGLQLREMISFDKHFRTAFQEKTRSGNNVLDYYFGRPLNDLVTPVTRFIKVNP
jgi:Fe-S-cluster containining protein